MSHLSLRLPERACPVRWRWAPPGCREGSVTAGGDSEGEPAAGAGCGRSDPERWRCLKIINSVTRQKSKDFFHRRKQQLIKTDRIDIKFITFKCLHCILYNWWTNFQRQNVGSVKNCINQVKLLQHVKLYISLWICFVFPLSLKMSLRLRFIP